jgi:heparin binding hemagglutinin HbhA
MAIALPTSADVRRAREQIDKVVSTQYDLVRTPFLAWVGANDLALTRLRELPERFRSDELRATYDEWAKRGEVTVKRIKQQPTVDRALRNAREADERTVRNVGSFVDQVHDRGEGLLGRVSSETRSAGEKAARRTEKVTVNAAGTVSDAGDELAGEILDAGSGAARETRSTTRKAANRTAPAKK